jgi:hypothetical protein
LSKLCPQPASIPSSILAATDASPTALACTVIRVLLAISSKVTTVSASSKGLLASSRAIALKDALGFDDGLKIPGHWIVDAVGAAHYDLKRALRACIGLANRNGEMTGGPHHRAS